MHFCLWHLVKKRKRGFCRNKLLKYFPFSPRIIYFFSLFIQLFPEKKKGIKIISLPLKMNMDSAAESMNTGWNILVAVGTMSNNLYLLLSFHLHCLAHSILLKKHNFYSRVKIIFTGKIIYTQKL